MFYKTHEYYVDREKIVRWKSNDRVPPNEILRDMAKNGDIGLGQMVLCQKASEKETAAFLEEYRKNFVMTDEMRAEATAAFGPGVKYTNVVTGKSYIS